jgi:hypothetical protein
MLFSLGDQTALSAYSCMYSDFVLDCGSVKYLAGSLVSIYIVSD